MMRGIVLGIVRIVIVPVGITAVVWLHGVRIGRVSDVAVAW